MSLRVADIDGGSVSYARYSRGPVPVICFHGYGESSSNFSFLEGSEDFSFYAVDLPWHGKTQWDKKIFTTNHLVNLTEKILSTHESTDPPILLGFSLGGRIALSLFEKWNNPVKKVVLLAPDGLKVNFWYRLATRTRSGRSLFRFTMKHPFWFFMILKAGNKLKLVNSSIFKFVNYYIGDKDVRQLLYDRWTGFASVRPDIKTIQKKIMETKTPFTIMYGKHDRIILPVVGERFAAGMGQLCEITIIDSGHQLLHAKHSKEILDALNHHR